MTKDRLKGVPAGAIIFIEEGAEMGQTPLTVPVKQRRSSLLLRIERDGYKPVSVNLKRNTSSWILGYVLLGADAFFGGALGASFGAGAIAGVAFTSLSIGIDYKTGAI